MLNKSFCVTILSRTRAWRYCLTTCLRIFENWIWRITRSESREPSWYPTIFIINYSSMIWLIILSIKDLNLQNNYIGDHGGQSLLEALTKNCVLKRLNLSENSLTDRISHSMFNFLNNNSSIEILILHWNKLGSLFGIYIAKALSKNRKVKVLDLSYNALGGSEDSDCISEW